MSWQGITLGKLGEGRKQEYQSNASDDQTVSVDSCSVRPPDSKVEIQGNAHEMLSESKMMCGFLRMAERK